MMANVGGLVTNCSARHGVPRRPSWIQNHNRFRHGEFTPLKLVGGSSTRGFSVEHKVSTYVSPKGSDYKLEFDDKYPPDSYWVDRFKEAIRTLKVVLVFLAEQPSQLKYIEWPSFQSTLKTAALTLVLVSLLIVALSSVDAALSYLLAVFLRKTG